MLELRSLRIRDRDGGLAQQNIAKVIDIPSGVTIGGTMNESAGVGVLGPEEQVPNLEPWLGLESGRTIEGLSGIGCRMPQNNAFRVEIEPGCGGPAIKYIAQDRVAKFGGMDTNLVCFAGQWLRMDAGVAGLGRSRAEAGFGHIRSGMGRAGVVAVASADEGGANPAFGSEGRAVREKNIGLLHGMFGELAGQGLVGAWGFSKNHHA
jgi:hypothetical protein